MARQREGSIVMRPRAVFAGCLIVCLVLLWSATDAHAGTRLVSPDRTVQGYIDRSHVPTPPVTLTLIFSTCPGVDYARRSCTGPDTPTTIWLNHYADFSHELGHVFDYTVMTDAFRAGFEKIIGDTRPWRSAPNSPHERFAEAYGLCSRFSRLPAYPDAGYGLVLSPRSFKRVCALIRRAGA